MTEFNDKDLDFVARRYDKRHYDTKKAIARFQKTNIGTTRHRWWMTAAAAAASIALVFAAGYGIRTWIRTAQEPAPAEQPAVLNPDVATTHVFVYNDAPLDLVLAELSDYYHCTIKAPTTDKRLTGTFPDDDVAFIVSLIEEALDIKITVE